MHVSLVGSDSVSPWTAAHRLLYLGASQAGTLEWVVVSSSGGSPRPGGSSLSPCTSCIGRWIFFFFFFLLLSQLGNRLTTGLPEKSCVPVQTFNSSIYESSVCGPRLLDFVSVCCSAGRIWLGLRQGESEGGLSETLRSWLF